MSDFFKAFANPTASTDVAFATQSPPNQQPKTISTPTKQRRISRACDFCSQRSIRCKPSTEEPQRCQSCFDYGVGCTYVRPTKKRGTKRGSKRNNNQSSTGSGSRDGEQDANILLALVHGSPDHENISTRGILEKWKSMVVDNEATIKHLVHVYFEVVYPLFPLFHRPSMLDRLRQREYLTNYSFFADIMSICALASSRARDGALFPGRWDTNRFHEPSSEVFFTAAREALPRDLSAMKGLDWMRTCVVLALYGIQVSNIDIMHQYLGIYHTLVNIDSLHDEKNWPKNIGIVEIEMRRRLFWSMYQLEVYASTTWNSVIRCREAQSHVLYPSEINDEFFSDAGYQGLNTPVQGYNLPRTFSNPSCWLYGWNFTTELYRVLEHAMDDLHRRRSAPIGSFSPIDLFGRDTTQHSVVLSKVMYMYDDLPRKFKEAKLPTNGKPDKDEIYSFQAANITATLQLVRMILFTSEDATVEQKCKIARDLLDGFSKIPIVFLRAISSPLLHHLAGIGSILGSVMESPLSESSYLELRHVLLSMAELLENLEQGITRNVGAASRLRTHITSIDNYMTIQRQRGAQFSIDGLSAPPSFRNTCGNDSTTPKIDPSLQVAAYQDSANPYTYQTSNAINGAVEGPEITVAG
ncbi:Xylanolytic transcriptional activator [Lachnellula hyalina]|uniref:Xylanolytic transcriptional activator n=1 Tax=Lachnellula hyalina TaxID=1316788 RepID=A0A8H8TXI7_9HELO|nr:Xylanolytic transcriptional activator [Lachnellula hyalina]TVY23021.1 Xylanolytic transcriptional activator [Lachnellula hyalina]